MDGNNDIDKMAKSNQDIIRYIREHEKEFSGFSLNNENILPMLTSLSKDMSLLDLYLENARRLEDLKVSRIYLTPSFENEYQCGIYRDRDGNIINIQKYYTDGNIIAKEESLEDELFNYSEIPFSITNASFLLHASNNEDFIQCRGIYITDFGFNGDKLPDETEIQSYTIPKQLLKK